MIHPELQLISLHFNREHGLDKGRNGRWEEALRQLKLDKGSARWVVNYQIAENLPPDKCFFLQTQRRTRKTRFTQKYGEKNRAIPTLFQPIAENEHASIDPAPDDKVDDSPDQRLPVECVFVLTYQEKRKFMEAVAKLGTFNSTEEMFRAVIRAANMDEKAADA
ncbi:MAG TPA: hypothetical protein VJP02_14005 [Candidatus Sulfotelmatobacter sp.]|nr:hypothetical protein [Candidatus Sulfotelmatobacter sp.]